MPQLTILETSDLHGALLPIRYADNAPIDGGLAKIATLVQRERALARNLLYIDNGDLIQGTPLAYHHARLDPTPPDPMVTALGMAGCCAAVVGNHEFNYGLDVLRKAMRESPFPWLCANIADEASGQPAFGPPFVVKETEEGARIGILGLTTPYIPNWEQPGHIAGLTFLDAVEAAARWVPRLRNEERCDVVVVSYHGGFERDLQGGEPTERPTSENQGYRLCAEVPGIDVLLTGHQHRQIAGAEVNGVAVVQPGTGGTVLGKVVLHLDRDARGRWRVVDKRSELVPVEGVAADPDILRLARPYEEKTQAWLDTPIGRIEGEMRVLDPMAARLADSAPIEFVNRVLMDVSGAPIACTALFDNQAPGFPQDVTMRQIAANYIYPNTLKVLRLRGRDIRAALELSAEYFALDDDGRVAVSRAYLDPKVRHYDYDMWEGICYRIQVSRPVGERVAELTCDGRPLADDAEFDVAMNSYRAAGGGNFWMFQDKPLVREIQTDISELLADYIAERKVVRAAVDGNWEVVP